MGAGSERICSSWNQGSGIIDDMTLVDQILQSPLLPNYWIVDPDTRTVEQYLLRGESYAPPVKVCDGTLESTAITGFRIPSQALFDEDVRPTVLAALIGGPG